MALKIDSVEFISSFVHFINLSKYNNNCHLTVTLWLSRLRRQTLGSDSALVRIRVKVKSKLIN